MKKFFMIAAMAVVALTASAQKPEVGQFSIMPKVGFGPSFFSNAKDYKITTVGGDTEGLGNNGTFTLGAEAQYQVAENFALSAGLTFDYFETNKIEVSSTETQLKLTYLDIPVLAHLNLGNHFGIEAGLQPGFALSSKDGDKDYKDATQSFRFAIPVGITYTFNSPIVLGVRYAIPVTKTYKKEFDDKMTVSGIHISVGYRFDL